MYDHIRESRKAMRGYWPGLYVTWKSTLGRDTDVLPSSNKNEELFSALISVTSELNVLYLVQGHSGKQVEARVSVTARTSGTRTRMTPNDTASISNDVSKWVHS